MKYVSIDIETTCVEPKCPDNILMVAMLVEDTKNKMPRQEIPTFACLVNRSIYSGTPFALSMNNWIFDMLTRKDDSKYPIYESDEWVSKAIQFLRTHFDFDDDIFATGKNVGSFDLLFFPDKLKSMFHYRHIDPGSMFIDWNKGPISLSKIKKNLGIDGVVTHDAVDDAWDVIQILRTTY
jgi:oligoribonuclease (3'-5' exoribonuclease)